MAPTALLASHTLYSSASACSIGRLRASSALGLSRAAALAAVLCLCGAVPAGARGSSPRAPLVVLKLARTGSTFLAAEIDRTGCGVGEREVSNDIGDALANYTMEGKLRLQKEGWPPDKCARLVRHSADVLGGGNATHLAFYTLNPFKYGLSVAPRGGGPSCWDVLASSLAAMRPQPMVMSLVRDNAVATALSQTRARWVLSTGGCDGTAGTPWRESKCASVHKPMPLRNSVELVKMARRAMRQAALLRDVSNALAERLSHPCYRCSYEELLAAGHGRQLSLPPPVRRLLGLQPAPALAASRSNGVAGPPRSEMVIGFSTLRSYVAAEAPDLLGQLDAWAAEVKEEHQAETFPEECSRGTAEGWGNGT